MNKALYKFYLDCGRMGFLDGLFICNKEDVEEIITNKKEIYFGEVLGKHSEISCALDEENIELVSDDAKVVEILETLANRDGTVSGYNPVSYYKDMEL